MKDCNKKSAQNDLSKGLKHLTTIILLPVADCFFPRVGRDHVEERNPASHRWANKGGLKENWYKASYNFRNVPLTEYQVYHEERLDHLANGTELTLRNVQPLDEGEYACQVRVIVYIIVVVMVMVFISVNITIIFILMVIVIIIVFIIINIIVIVI